MIVMDEYEDDFDAYEPSGYSIFSEDQYGNIISANFTQDGLPDLYNTKLALFLMVLQFMVEYVILWIF